MSQQQQKLAIDLEAQVLAAAQSVLGSDRKLKATFNEATGRVEVYQTFVVARMVKNPPREISIADAKLLEGDYAVGSEVTFQLFYGRGDQTRAEQLLSQNSFIIGSIASSSTVRRFPRPSFMVSSLVCSRPFIPNFAAPSLGQSSLEWPQVLEIERRPVLSTRACRIMRFRG